MFKIEDKLWIESEFDLEREEEREVVDLPHVCWEGGESITLLFFSSDEFRFQLECVITNVMDFGVVSVDFFCFQVRWDLREGSVVVLCL